MATKVKFNDDKAIILPIELTWGEANALQTAIEIGLYKNDRETISIQQKLDTFFKEFDITQNELHKVTAI